NGDLAVLERLAQSLERGSAKLENFIEKEDALVSERDLARSNRIASPDESSIANRVMRTAEGSCADESLFRGQKPGHAVDHGNGERVVEVERWQYGRHPAGEHRLSAARGTDEEQIVAAGGGDLQS